MPDSAMTGEAREIAAGLTPTVREFVAGPMYSFHAYGISAAWSSDTNWWAARHIAKLGLAERRIVEPGLVASVLTPLGLAVRQILQESGQ